MFRLDMMLILQRIPIIFKNKRVETKKTSGVFTGGGIGITFGSKSEKHDYETEGWTQSECT